MRLTAEDAEFAEKLLEKEKTGGLFPVISAFSASSAANAVLVVAGGRHHRPSRLHIPQQRRFGREVIERDLVYVPRQSKFLQRPTRAEKGYILAGPNGAGHFVKMIHNGIEYGLM